MFAASQDSTGGMRRPRAHAWRRLLLVICLLPASSVLPYTIGSAGAQSQQAASETAAVPATTATVPANTALYLRLLSAVNTKKCKMGDPVTATVAREVDAQDQVAIPIGAVLQGSVEKCSDPKAPNERAELLLNFNRMVISGAKDLAVTGRISGVGNARETMLADGTIVGVAATEVPATLLGGVLQKLGSLDPSIADEIKKQRVGEVSTSIDYPAGTELQFTLTQALKDVALLPPSSERLAADLADSIMKFLANAPQRAANKDNKPGDPINIVLIGTAQEIQDAFHKAGWTEPQQTNEASVLGTVRAVINDEGYASAPISDLYLFGRKQDVAFERTLNTFNKRHHLRLWQTAQRSPDGRPIWLGAATHDTGIDIHPGVISHATDPQLDDEREEVRSDLVSSAVVQAVEMLTPPHPLTGGFTATGGAWQTDGRLAAIELKPAEVRTSAQ